jgi:hypothetical protein
VFSSNLIIIIQNRAKIIINNVILRFKGLKGVDWGLTCLPEVRGLMRVQ